MIKKLLLALLINGVAIYLASQVVSSLHLSQGIRSLLIVLVAFTAVHLVVKPILNLFLGPLNFLTFGLVSLAIDIALLYGLSVLLPQMSFSAWQFTGFELYGLVVPAYNFNPLGSTIVAAIVINTIRSVLNYLTS